MGKKRPMSKKIKILIIAGSVLAFVLLVSLIVFIIGFSGLSQIKDVESGTTNELAEESQEESADTNLPELGDADFEGINGTDIQSALPQGIYHFMFYGLDTRDKNQFTGTRSDVMLLVTMDTRNKAIKLTSFMRDMLVPIPGHGYSRINAAYAFGGPQLSTEVFAKQFGLQITNYAVVNFWSMAKIIDSLNGVEIDITSKELDPINENISEINRLDSSQKISLIKKAGKQRLNGSQTVAYMRIRHGGSNDFERTQRQRTVLAALLGNLADMSLDKVVALLQVLPGQVRTNLNQSEMLDFAKAAYELRNAPLSQLRIPIDGGYKNASYQGMAILNVDFKKNMNELKKFLQIDE